MKKIPPPPPPPRRRRRQRRRRVQSRRRRRRHRNGCTVTTTFKVTSIKALSSPFFLSGASPLFFLKDLHPKRDLFRLEKFHPKKLRVSRLPTKIILANAYNCFQAHERIKTTRTSQQCTRNVFLTRAICFNGFCAQKLQSELSREQVRRFAARSSRLMEGLILVFFFLRGKYLCRVGRAVEKSLVVALFLFLRFVRPQRWSRGPLSER